MLSDNKPHSPNAVNSQRCCCNVGGHYTLPDSFRWRLKDLFLLFYEDRDCVLICSKIPKDIIGKIGMKVSFTVIRTIVYQWA